MLLHLVPASQNGHARSRKKNRLSPTNTVDTINFALALNKLDEVFLEEYGEILSSQMKGMDYPKKHSQNLRLLVSYLASKATVHGKRKMRLQGGLIEKVENAKDKQARLRQEAMAEKKKKKELEKIAKALEKEKQKRLMDEKKRLREEMRLAEEKKEKSRRKKEKRKREKPKKKRKLEEKKNQVEHKKMRKLLKE